MHKVDLIALTADIVVAHVANSSVAISDIGNLVPRIHEALATLGREGPALAARAPAVSIRASVRADDLVCLEDGKRVALLSLIFFGSVRVLYALVIGWLKRRRCDDGSQGISDLAVGDRRID